MEEKPQQSENKRNKKVSKLSSKYTDDMILYIQNPKDSTQKLPELKNKFSQAAGYKINIQKSVTFLYTNNELLKKEYKNTIPFKISPQKIKYLGIHLTRR